MGDFEYPEIIKDTQDKNKVNKVNEHWGEQKNDKGETIKNCHSEELLGLGRKNKTKGKQSPININTSSVQDCHLMCQLEINYNPIKLCKIYKNNQGIINLDWDENSYITYNKLKYPLKKIYFHTPSHHLIDGNNSDMEINLYHSLSDNYLPDTIKTDQEDLYNHNRDEITENENKEDKKLNHHKGIIISILVNQEKEHAGSSINKFISQFITNPKFKKLQKKKENSVEIAVGKNWNIKSLLPKKKSFFSYEGSLPMPPCLEPYTWIVFEEPIKMYIDYLNIIRREGNPSGYRDAHPLNGRIVLHNTSVEIHEDEIEEETKNEIINKMLAPIRITVDSRTGVDYRIGSRKIIDSYMGGTNQDYRENEESLTEINKAWDKLGKKGTQDLTVTEILALKEDTERYYEHVQNMIFNALIYNLEDYFNKYMEYTGYKETYMTDEMTEEQYVEKLHSILEELSRLNISGAFFKEEDKKLYTFDKIKENFKIEEFKTETKEIFDLVENDTNPKIQNKPDKKFLLFLLLNWKMNNLDSKNFTNLFTFIEDTDEIYKFNDFILNTLNSHAEELEKEEISHLIFKFQGEDLTFTLDGEECQDWGSNEVHYEGGLIGKANLFSKEGYTFDELKKHTNLIDSARDGLLNKVNGKWKPHNKCRDPGGLKGATWCYTKNPKVRWDYCMIPDRVGNSKKYLLFVIFILLIVISIFFVKMIFREELFSQFIAKLTGANIASEAVFKANQVANSIKNKIN